MRYWTEHEPVTPVGEVDIQILSGRKCRAATACGSTDPTGTAVVAAARVVCGRFAPAVVAGVHPSWAPRNPAVGA
jgi:hypothetical protein